jgi:hypothetical protein
VSEAVAHEAVMRELKIAERMRPLTLKVEPDALVSEVLTQVATHLINAFSVGANPRIYRAMQYIFADEHAFFQSVQSCEQLLWLGQRDTADALALRLACQRVAVTVVEAVPDGHPAAALLRDVRDAGLFNSSITVLDVARAIAAEGANGAGLSRIDALRQRLRHPMTPKSDLHAHHSAFMSTLRSLSAVGYPPPHDVDQFSSARCPRDGVTLPSGRLALRAPLVSPHMSFSRP